MATRTVLDMLPAFMVEELEATSRKMYDALRAIPLDAAAQLGGKEREIQTLTKHCDSWYNKAKAATLRLAEANKVIGALEREVERLLGIKKSARAAATMVLDTPATQEKSPSETNLMPKSTLTDLKPKAPTKNKKKKSKKSPKKKKQKKSRSRARGSKR